MSGIVLSASVRQNLLSLQSTADLLATTQNRLATGKKVNTALDNPTNFFTAQSLDARAGDINNLVDGIGNGVQVLQAAITGITSLQKLVDTAKSLANQALQSAVGYSTKSNVSATISGATSSDLRGTTTYTSATASSNVLFDGSAGDTTAATGTTTLGGTIGTVTGGTVNDNQGTPAAISATTLIYGEGAALATAGLSDGTNTKFTDGTVITVNGHSVTFKAGAAPTTSTVPSGYGVRLRYRDPEHCNRRREVVRRCGLAADLDRCVDGSVDHRHRQCAFGARPDRQHRNRDQLHRESCRGLR